MSQFRRHDRLVITMKGYRMEICLGVDPYHAHNKSVILKVGNPSVQFSKALFHVSNMINYIYSPFLIFRRQQGNVVRKKNVVNIG